jgi:hypothetical protein
MVGPSGISTLGGIQLSFGVSLQSTMQEMIWRAAKAGDKARLKKCLVGATDGDLAYEEKDLWVGHVEACY